MKKARIFIVLLIVAVLCTMALACDKESATAYTVTVVGGTADKTTATSGETVTLTVGTVPEGSAFLNWVVNGESITGNTFTMPEQNTTVTAAYDKVNYTVTVTGGTADKATGKLGDTITLTPSAAEAGYAFKNWTVNGKAITGNTFTMTAANAVVAAVFEKISYTITVTGGTADKATAQIGDTITLTPSTAEAGYEFKNWTVNDEAITGNTFTMTAANAVVAAVFEKVNYTVTVTGGTADKATAQIGDTITLTPSAAEAGQEFKNWTVNGKAITGNTFTMTAENAVVAAVFGKISYTITVTGGKADKATAQIGDTITLTPSTAEAGYAFKNWTVNGKAITGNTFTMTAANAVVAAVFEKVNYTITVTGGTADKTTAQMGDNVTLTLGTVAEGKAFAHWKVNGAKIEGNTFAMPSANAEVVALFIELNQKIATPDNSKNELIFAESANTPCPVALDRADGKTKTMFFDATDYVIFYVYDVATADTKDYLAKFKMIRDPSMDGNMNAGKITSMDGKLSIPFNGSPKDYYFDTTQWNNFFNILKYELGYKYSEGRTYYFAAQSVAKTTTVSVEGVEVTFTSSDISVIGSKGLAKDASKGEENYTITVEGGFIDGDKTTVSVGYGVTLQLSTSLKTGYTFIGWFVKEGETISSEAISNELSFKVNITKGVIYVAQFVKDSELEKTPIDTPDNTESKLLFKEAAGSIALDRAGEEAKSMFKNSTDHVVFYIYTSAEATNSVGSFIIRTEFGKDPSGGQVMVGWVESLDGKLKEYIVRGGIGNYYIDGTDVNRFYSVIGYALGYDYSEGQKYYYSAKAVAIANSVYEDSATSLIGANGFAKDESKGTERYTVTLLDGAIDGDKKTVTAGYGVKLNLSVEMPADKDLFLGWKLVTLDADNNEVLGSVITRDLETVYTVTASVTIRPVFANSGEVELIKVATPDNSKDQMIAFKGAPLIEYDRQKDADGNRVTAFQTGVGYVRVYIYTSNEDTAQAIAFFDIKLKEDGKSGYFEKGAKTYDLLGHPDDFYSQDGNAHNFIKDVIATYDPAVPYYYAFQAMADDSGLYANSDIGAKGKGWVSI